jgi:DNA-binding NtrC family response regulator
LLKIHDFPGNIRELEGLIYDALVRHESGVLSLKPFRNALEEGRSESIKIKSEEIKDSVDSANIFESIENLPPLKASSEMLIHEALRRADGNQTIAAQLLGMTRTALNKRLNRNSE